MGTVKNEITKLDLHGALEHLFKDAEYQNNFNDDLLTYGMRSQGRKTEEVKKEISLYRRVYAVDALKMRLGLDHPFIIELSRVSNINALTKAGSTKPQVEQSFPFNKE